MFFILFLITTILSGYIDGQNTYVRNDLVCKKWVCSVFQYQLQIVDNVYNLTNNNIKSNEIVSDCYNLNEFQLKKVNDAYNLMRFQYACRIIAISLDSFFTSNVSSTVDITCESRTNCSRYRYDRIGSSVASTRIGPCTYNSCTKCAFRGPWQLKLTSMMLERTMDTGYCEAIEEMSIADYFILDSPISSSTVTTTEAKDSPITSSTVTTKAKDSPITSSTVTTTTAKDSPITSSTVTATTAKDSPITSSTVTTKAKDSPITSSTVTTKAKDSPITSSTVTATTAKDSTSKKSQSTLIWSFGTITVNLISCLLINGLK